MEYVPDPPGLCVYYSSATSALSITSALTAASAAVAFSSSSSSSSTPIIDTPHLLLIYSQSRSHMDYSIRLSSNYCSPRLTSSCVVVLHG